MNIKYDGNDRDMFYSHGIDPHPRLIGHMRWDNGKSGDEFWTSWFEGTLDETENNEAFKRMLTHVVDGMRKTHIGNKKLMCYVISEKHPQYIDESQEYYGFMVDTEHYEFYVRFTTRGGMYNYIYCYVNEVK